MSPTTGHHTSLFATVIALTMLALPAAANCFDPFNRQSSAPTFEFVTSKSAQVAPGEVKVDPTAFRDSFELTAKVSASTIREVVGTKESQRSEILETFTSSAATDTGAWYCYAWTMALEQNLTLPAAVSPRAKLTVAQFHQTTAISGKEPAVLFIDLDSDGNLIAVFNDAVGRRSSVLVPGGPTGRDVLGKTWEIALAAKWSTGNDGRVIITVREKDKGMPVEVLNDTGQNATSGHVYQKLGVYRHNIERDPTLARATISVDFTDISRNGVKATYRGLTGGLSPVTAGAPASTSTGRSFGTANTTTTTVASAPMNNSASAAPSSSGMGNQKTPPAQIMKVTMGRGSGSGGRGMAVRN